MGIAGLDLALAWTPGRLVLVMQRRAPESIPSSPVPPRRCPKLSMSSPPPAHTPFHSTPPHPKLKPCSADAPSALAYVNYNDSCGDVSAASGRHTEAAEARWRSCRASRRPSAGFSWPCTFRAPRAPRASRAPRAPRGCCSRIASGLGIHEYLAPLPRPPESQPEVAHIGRTAGQKYELYAQISLEKECRCVKTQPEIGKSTRGFLKCFP